MSIPAASVSLCFINRDGARWLPWSLAPLAKRVGEVVFVDTGSTDDSVRIARREGAKVIEIAWSDDFSSARNVYLRHADRPWILALDSDEVLRPCDLDTLLAGLDASRPAGVRINVRHYEENIGHERWRPCVEDLGLPVAVEGFRRTRNLKLFPNLPGVQYRYPVHESVMPSLEEQGVPIVDTSEKVTVHHLGFVQLDRAGRRARAARNLILGQRKIREYPEHAQGFVELAELVLHHGDPRYAVALLARALRLAPDSLPAHLRLAEAFERLGNRDAARGLLEALIPESGDADSRILLALGRLAQDSGDLEAACRYLEKADCYEATLRLAVCRMQQGRFSEAWEPALRAAQQRSTPRQR